MPITFSIVEDNRGAREGFVALLSRAPGLRCVSSYGTGEEALQGIPRDKPNVALVDINLPGMSGIECVAKLKERLPTLKVVMLTRYEENDLIFNALRENKWNRRKAALALNISYRALIYKIREAGLSPKGNRKRSQAELPRDRATGMD